MTTSAPIAPYTSSLSGFVRARPLAVNIDQLTKRFPVRRGLRELLRGAGRHETTVVDQVSFDVAVGEVFGVLGPNGAGKSTIFRMLSTMVAPDAGTATVCGHDIWLEPSRVRTTLAAVSSDERSLNWRLSARENLLLFAALHKVPRKETEGLVTSMLRTVGLDGTGNKMVAAFSSGMRQRLLIARALLARPKVLLLDEPTRALDPISAQEFRQFLRTELVDRQRCTILLATHNADEALGFCDRVVVLNRGRVLATGTATELKARFSEERYRIWTTDPDHGCFAQLETLGMLRRLMNHAQGIDGWFVVDCAIPGDPSRTASVLQHLFTCGVSVARLERVEPSLADLIAGIIGASARENANA